MSDFWKFVFNTWIVTNYGKFNFAIVTNVQLKLWEMRNDDKCSFCNIVPEDIIHLFCTCPVIQELLNLIKDWAIAIQPDIEGFGTQNILFNMIHKNPKKCNQCHCAHI